MKKPILIQKWSNKDKNFIYNVYDDSDFSKLTFIKQVYAVLYDKDFKVAIVKNKNGFTTLPGGGVEIGETVLDTLVREMKEETNCDVLPAQAVPFFYQQSFQIKEDGDLIAKGAELRYFIPVETFNEFVEDPDNGDNGDITDVLWIQPTEIAKELAWWGDTAKFIQDRTIKYFNMLKSSHEQKF